MNLIIKDKSVIDFNKVKQVLNMWLATDFTFQNGFESHYHGIERKILVEEYIDDGHSAPLDYKFVCFNGKPTYMQVFSDRFTDHLSGNYYDMDFNFVEISRNDIRNNPNIKHKKPSSFELMREYAEKLSAPFKFVRVDFYEIGGEPYLGEMTFTPGAMMFRYTDPEKDVEMGNLLKLP